MKILHVHNYHKGRGGMEVIFEYTSRVLREHGHDVIELTRDSAELDSPLAKLGATASGVYSLRAGTEARELIRKHQPDVAYIYNLYPMLSTSVVDACRSAGVPTVMNVQDYKLTCPMGQHLRGGKICTKCLDGSVMWSAVHACKGGRVTSAAYAITHGVNRLRGAYQRGVDLYVTPSRFAANHLIKAGFDPKTINVVPSMCDLAVEDTSGATKQYAAFVGRISPEKGIPVLVEASRLSGIPTRIAGNGEIAGLKESAPDHVTFTGPMSREQLPDFYRQARFLVVPSVWYETFGVVLTEAMTAGIPVIASDIGGMPEVFEHRRSGLLVPPNSPQALASAMRLLWDDVELCKRMGKQAREHALTHYTADAYYTKLTRVFERAIRERKQAHHHHPGHTLGRMAEVSL